MLYVGSVWGVLGKSGSKTEDAFSTPMEITYDDLQMMIGHLGEICYSGLFRNGGMAVQPVWISCVDLPVQRERERAKRVMHPTACNFVATSVATCCL